MPLFLLDDWQVSTLLDLGRVADPVEGSPLRAVRRFPRPLAPGEPGWDALVTGGLLLPSDDGSWRTNLLAASILEVCARPEEVISVGVSDPEQTGYTVARRGEVVAECTYARGLTKLSFPLTRTAALLTLMGALSGERPEPTPSGFRFRGSAAEAFVLASALRALREDPVPLTVGSLRAAVRRDAGISGYAAPFAIAAGPEQLAPLGEDPDAVDAAIESLVAQGLLTMRLDHLSPWPAAAEVLTGEPLAVMGIGRTEFPAGRAAHTSMTATRIGDRILTFRIASPAGGPVSFEWAEVDRVTLRWLVLGLFLSGDELTRVMAAADGAAPEPGVEELAAETPAPAAAAPMVAAWAPTHIVPADGLPAFAAPDPTAAAVARLDPSLPVLVDQQWGAWSHVVCENTWTAWVDGTRLIPVG